MLWPSHSLDPSRSGNWVLRGAVRNRLQRAHGRSRETGQEAVFLEPSTGSFFVLGSRLKAQPGYQLRSLPLAGSVYSSQHWGREKASSLSVPFAHSRDSSRSAPDCTGRIRGNGHHYGSKIILVMLIGKKNKRHLCHHLGPYISLPKPGLIVSSWDHRPSMLVVPAASDTASKSPTVCFVGNVRYSGHSTNSGTGLVI